MLHPRYIKLQSRPLTWVSGYVFPTMAYVAYHVSNLENLYPTAEFDVAKRSADDNYQLMITFDNDVDEAQFILGNR